MCIRDRDNYLPPASGQVFRFEIIGENIRDSYELNEANSWHRSLTQYPSGMYEIREIGSPYPVQYLVNSAELLDEARFEATAQRTNIIGIINRCLLYTSLALSLLCVVVNNTMLFLFIQRVRSLRFRKQDIRYSFSKAGEQIVIGLCLSLLQLFLQIAVSVCAFLPILYMLVSAFLSLFFVYWYACIAWLIYDQDTHIKDLFIKPCLLYTSLHIPLD